MKFRTAVIVLAVLEAELQSAAAGVRRGFEIDA